MLVSEQIRAARAVLNWTAKELADESDVSLATIQRMETSDVKTKTRGTDNALGKNLNAVQKALEKAGIVFISADSQGGVGVRLRK